MQQWYNCPRCNQYIQHGQPQCHNCGIAIGWIQPSQQPTIQQQFQQPKPEKKKSNRGTSIFLLIFSGFVILLLCLLAIAPKKPTPASAPALTIDAMDLYYAYQENAVAADLKYKDKVIDVEGYIGKIGKGLGGDPYVILTTGAAYGLMGVHCSFSSGSESDVAKLSLDQKVTVRGKCNGQQILNVTLDNCSLVQ